jgi:hypothetical protein
MRFSVGRLKEVRASAAARYILISALSVPMPLFDGAIQFLGCAPDATVKS